MDMQIENQAENDGGFWRLFIDVATVGAGLMLYFKTSEVMTAIAPLTLLGQTGLQSLYGISVGVLIEGVTLSLHFLSQFRNNQKAQIYKFILFAISGFCQFMDKYMVTDVMSKTTPMVEFFKFVALGIPLIIFGGLLWVAQHSKGSSSKRTSSWKGLVPTFKVFLYGSDNGTNVVRRPEVALQPAEVENSNVNFPKGEGSQ